MDVIGIAMGIVTIPMVLLTFAGIAGGIALLAAGAWPPVLVGIAALAIGIGLALVIERLVTLIGMAAIRLARRRGRGAGLWLGFVAGALPMAVILLWAWRCATLFPADAGARVPLALWQYAVATGPWTAFAMRPDGNRGTLPGIRAYAAHLGYWLLLAARDGLGAPPLAAAAAMALPAILPVAVGTLIAVADRAALRNVRI